MKGKQQNSKAPKEAAGKKGYKFDAKASTHKTSAGPRKGK